MIASRFFISLALLLIALTGCRTIGGGVVIHSPGPSSHQNLPPAHAPAHGRRAQQHYQYHYFPDAQVYFDLNRKLYFYISGNRWKVGVSLPDYFRLRLGDHQVNLDMETDKPYQHFGEHKRKYPAGKKRGHKKEHPGKGQGKGRKNKQD